MSPGCIRVVHMENVVDIIHTCTCKNNIQNTCRYDIQEYINQINIIVCCCLATRFYGKGVADCKIIYSKISYIYHIYMQTQYRYQIR